LANTDTIRIQALIAKLNDHGERRPKEAAAKLVRAGKKAIPELIAALKNSSNIRIRRWAAYTLGFFKDRRVIAPLKKGIHDPNMSVRLLAMEALEQVSGAKAGRHLLPLLNDSSGGVRARTVDALTRLQHRPAIGSLMKATRDRKWYVRQTAARALGVMKARRAAGCLKRLQKDSRKIVRETAVQSLARILPRTAMK
jgi:HEAT repeat protein